MCIWFFGLAFVLSFLFLEFQMWLHSLWLVRALVLLFVFFSLRSRYIIFNYDVRYGTGNEVLIRLRHYCILYILHVVVYK